jgi:integrase
MEALHGLAIAELLFLIRKWVAVLQQQIPLARGDLKGPQITLMSAHDVHTCSNLVNVDLSSALHIAPYNQRQAPLPEGHDRHLSVAELQRFWHALDQVDAVPRTFIRFNLCLGGQRAVQLLRASWPAYDFANSTVLLRDGKGRGGIARDHLVPLTKMALDILQPLRVENAQASGPFVARGEQSLHPSTVSKVVTEVWGRLAAEDVQKEIGNPIPKFAFRDLRRTCETQLASLGVNLETRAQLLSHGRSGVQAKHYDRHTYLAEKRRALRKWAQHLTRVIDSKPAQLVVLINIDDENPPSVAKTT